MSLRRIEADVVDDPLDIVEHLITENDWPFERQGDDELVSGVAGQWSEYQLWFSRRIEHGALQFSCAFDLRVPEPRKRELNSLIVLVNERLWLGHFDLWNDERMLVFRHTLLLRDGPAPTARQIEQVVETALSECERYYPAFQFAIWGGKDARDALESAMIETMGEA